MPPAIANSVVVNPTPADEQKRLEAVASEVARRRQLREQASQPGGVSAPGAPQVIQQPPQQVQQPQQNQNANPQNNNAQRPAQRAGGGQRQP
jgi:hypothetical protein